MLQIIMHFMTGIKYLNFIADVFHVDEKAGRIASVSMQIYSNSQRIWDSRLQPIRMA